MLPFAPALPWLTGYNLSMSNAAPGTVRDHLSGLRLANEHELAELRRTKPETKLRQLWTLMSAAEVFEDPAQREAETLIVRERWAQLCRALGV